MRTVHRKGKVRDITVVRHETILDADYHQFTLIAGPPRELVHGRYPELPLGIFAEDTISVKVGIKGGRVHVVMEVHDTPPDYVDREWEDIAEGDLVHDTCEGAHLLSFWDDDPDDPGLRGRTPPGRRRYRVRICARGKDTHFDGYLVDRDPVEDYLIQLWPSAHAGPPRQIKHLSGR